MSEWQLFEPGTDPFYTQPEWYEGIERAPHLEQGLHTGRLHLAADYVREIPMHRDCTLVDLGAGDGGLLSLVRLDVAACWGYDLMPENVRGAAERGAHVIQGDFLNDEIEWGDITVCTETLEHLVHPHEFVQRMRAHSSYLIASSPYTETDVHHYEHHAWAWDLDGYAALLEQGGFTVVRQQTVDIFQVVLAQ